MYKLIEALVDKGVNVNIFKTNEGVLTVDLNLQSKSWMYMREHEGKFYIDMRYDETYVISDINDIPLCLEELAEFAYIGVHGRNFINEAWLNIILERGLDNPCL